MLPIQSPSSSTSVSAASLIVSTDQGETWSLLPSLSPWNITTSPASEILDPAIFSGGGSSGCSVYFRSVSGYAWSALTTDPTCLTGWSEAVERLDLPNPDARVSVADGPAGGVFLSGNFGGGGEELGGIGIDKSVDGGARWARWEGDIGQGDENVTGTSAALVLTPDERKKGNSIYRVIVAYEQPGGIDCRQFSYNVVGDVEDIWNAEMFFVGVGLR